jgi:hypothetical protein
MKELLYPLNRSLEALSEYVAKNNFSFNKYPYKEVLQVLTLIKEKVIHGEQLHTRILRAMKDVYVITFRNFKGTPLYDEIDNLDNCLIALVKDYEKLEPLGMDFGKGNPI